jgi:hypothetical protein
LLVTVPSQIITFRNGVSLSSSPPALSISVYGSNYIGSLYNFAFAFTASYDSSYYTFGGYYFNYVTAPFSFYLYTESINYFDPDFDSLPCSVFSVTAPLAEFIKTGIDSNYLSCEGYSYAIKADEYGFDEGFISGFEDGYNAGLSGSDSDVFDAGYKAGYKAGSYVALQPMSWASSIFTSLGKILNIQLMPNITLGAVVFVPIVLTVFLFIFNFIRH